MTKIKVVGFLGVFFLILGIALLCIHPILAPTFLGLAAVCCIGVRKWQREIGKSRDRVKEFATTATAESKRNVFAMGTGIVLFLSLVGGVGAWYLIPQIHEKLLTLIVTLILVDCYVIVGFWRQFILPAEQKKM